MVTGRRIEAAPGGHGFTYNTDRGSTVHKAAGRYVPSVFYVVHDKGGYSGRQPVRNGGVANLVIDVLDRPAVRGSEFNRPQELRLFPR